MANCSPYGNDSLIDEKNLLFTNYTIPIMVKKNT